MEDDTMNLSSNDRISILETHMINLNDTINEMKKHLNFKDTEIDTLKKANRELRKETKSLKKKDPGIKKSLRKMSLSSRRVIDVRFSITRPELAKQITIPTQGTPGSLGYDIAAIIKLGEKGNAMQYGTGIAIQPIDGYCFEMVNRSSFIKQNYKIAGTGIIDSDYRGELIVSIIKLKDDIEHLEPPFTLFQLVARKEIFVNWIEGHLDETSRKGGYGSTGAKFTEPSKGPKIHYQPLPK